jgi:hypothetical protein
MFLARLLLENVLNASQALSSFIYYIMRGWNSCLNRVSDYPMDIGGLLLGVKHGRGVTLTTYPL